MRPSIETFVIVLSVLAAVSLQSTLANESVSKISNAPIGLFEDIVSRRMKDLSTWPRLELVSLDIVSSDKNIYLAKTNSVGIIAFAAEINSYLTCHSERDTEPLTWSWTHTQRVAPGSPPPETWSWQYRNAIPLERALALLRQRGYGDVWLSVKLDMFDQVLREIPGRLVYTFERDPSFFWQPRFIRMAAATGKLLTGYSSGGVAGTEATAKVPHSNIPIQQSSTADNVSLTSRSSDYSVLPVSAFESFISQRLSAIHTMFPYLRLVEVSMISSTEDISMPNTNSIRITAIVTGVYGYMHTSTIVRRGRVRWTSPEYQHVRPGSQLRQAWAWSMVRVMSLQRMLNIVALNEGFPGPWLAASLSAEVPPSAQAPLGLLYTLQWPSASPEWKPLYVSAVTGKLVGRQDVSEKNYANKTLGGV